MKHFNAFTISVSSIASFLSHFSMASTESKPAIKKVGATLLDNWVEERAVADQLISEHANIQKLSKAGHKVFCKILFIRIFWLIKRSH